MKLLLLADNVVGYEIVRFLLDRYPGDLGHVVTLAENEIFRELKLAGIPVTVYVSDKDVYQRVSSESFDFGFLLWWPKLIRNPLLSLPNNGFINTHPSFLPYNRGKHYNFWALVEESPFGVSLHYVTEGIDSGDVLAQVGISYDWTDNGGSLFEKAKDAMVSLFIETYPRFRLGEVVSYPQDLSLGSFHMANELESASRIELTQTYTARELLNRLRARTFHGYPACWFQDDDNRYEVRVEIRRVEK